MQSSAAWDSSAARPSRPSKSSTSSSEAEVTCVRRRDVDDTLPSPPASAMLVHASPLTAVAYDRTTASWWVPEELHADASPPSWMLQGTVMETETEEEAEEIVVREERAGQPAVISINASSVAHTTRVEDVQPFMDGTESSSSARTQEEQEVERADDRGTHGHPSSLRKEEEEIASAEEPRHAALSSITPQPVVNSTQEESASSSSASEPTLVIAVPPNRTSPDVQLPYSEETSHSTTVAAAATNVATERPSAWRQQRRRPVLVSPAMTEESPDSEAWMSPGRADTADMRSRGSQESRRLTVASERQGSCQRAAPSQPSEAVDVAESRGSSSAYPATALSRDSAARSPSPRHGVELRRDSSLAAPPPPLSPSPSQSVRVSPPQENPRQLSSPPLDDTRIETHSPRNSSPNRNVGSVSCSNREGVATSAEAASPVVRSQLQRLRLQLNQAERAAALQSSLHEATLAEKADLQIQLEELLHIQAELERRAQEGEVARADEVQRHHDEQLAWAAEQRAHEEQRGAAHAKELRQREEEMDKLRAEVESSHATIQGLRTELADAQEELQVVMREVLDAQRQLAAAQHEKLADAVELKKTAEASATRLADTRAALRAAAERAAVANVSFQTLCSRLEALAEHPSLVASRVESSSLSLSGRLSVGDTEGGNRGGATSLIDDVRRAVVDGMQEDDVAVALSEIISGACVRDSSGVPLQRGTPLTNRTSEDLAAAASDFCEAGVDGRDLSAACRASFHQHREQVQRVVGQVAETCRRVARETRVAADARAAEVEHALSSELRLLRAQRETAQQRCVPERHDVAAGASPNSSFTATGVRSWTAPQGEQSRSSVAVNTERADGMERRSESAGAVTRAPPSSTQISGGNEQKLREVLVESRRDLQLEKQHTELLRNEVAALHGARHTATQLARAEEALQDVRVSVAQLVRGAVDELHDTYASVCRGASSVGNAASDAAGASTPVFSDSPQAGPSVPLSCVRAPVTFTDTAVLRSIRKAVLLAEAQVERVGDELLNETRRLRISGAAAHQTTGVSAIGWPASLLDTRTTPQQQRQETVAAAAASVPRSAAQQLVYEEMQAMLHRSHAEGGSNSTRGDRTPPPQQHPQPSRAASASASVVSPQSRYSPDGSRWLAGIRPPPQTQRAAVLPTGAVTSPARQQQLERHQPAAPSPYVRAYMHSLSPSTTVAAEAEAQTYHATRTAIAPADAPSVFSATTALRLFEGMTATTQELRNVSQMLELLHDNATTQEERQRACLQKWEARITNCVEAALNDVATALAMVHPPDTALAFMSQPHATRLRGVPATCTDALSISPHFEAVQPAPTSHPHVCLADVLAGKATRTDASLSKASPAAATGAVVFHAGGTPA